jgi:alkanesulfonate monooxygenase SsuD/methylene tetrahydromethanopterin reductase-like flavin-dependent oxidoreductase (luciferase family)
MTTRDPVFLAKQVATVDVLSRGRLELGLGAGWLAEEAGVLGRPRDHRTARMDETIDIFRKAWTFPSFSHQGRSWQIPEVWLNPKPAQGPNVPIWIGGTGKAAVGVAAAKAVGVLVLGSADHVREIAMQLHDVVPRKKIAGFMGLGQSDDEMRARELRNAGADLVVVNPHPETRPNGASVKAATQRLARFMQPVAIARQALSEPEVHA